MTVVANDDGVSLVRVLVAHGTGQIQRQAHAVHAGPSEGESAVDLREAEQGDRGCHDKKSDQDRKRQRQPTRSPGTSAKNPGNRR